MVFDIGAHYGWTWGLLSSQVKKILKCWWLKLLLVLAHVKTYYEAREREREKERMFWIILPFFRFAFWPCFWLPVPVRILELFDPWVVERIERAATETVDSVSIQVKSKTTKLGIYTFLVWHLAIKRYSVKPPPCVVAAWFKDLAAGPTKGGFIVPWPGARGARKSSGSRVEVFWFFF